MASKKNVATVETPETPTPVAPAAMLDQDQLAYLVSQRRALNEQIKAAKANRPAESKLERVIARQATLTRRNVERVARRVRARVAAGQPTEEALDAVLAQYRAAILVALASGETVASDTSDTSDED